MSRNRQYRVFLELDESLRLNHEHDMTTQLPQGPCVCTADLVEDVETLLGAQAVTAPTVDQALEDVAQGRQSWCAVSLRGVYKTDWLYDHLDAKKLYLNRILPAADGTLLAIVSPKLVYVPGEENMIGAVFYMSSESGSLAEALSVLADNKQNMEFIHLEKKDSADELHQFRLYVDFDGCVTSIDTRAAIYQLQTELPYFRVVGSRKRITLP